MKYTLIPSLSNTAPKVKKEFFLQKYMFCCWFTGSSGYDAIAYYDTDIEIRGDITPVLRCAASGKFLSTSGAAAATRKKSGKEETWKLCFVNRVGFDIITSSFHDSFLVFTIMKLPFVPSGCLGFCRFDGNFGWWKILPPRYSIWVSLLWNRTSAYFKPPWHLVAEVGRQSDRPVETCLSLVRSSSCSLTGLRVCKS